MDIQMNTPGETAGQIQGDAAACCSPAEQAICCDPVETDACCGPVPTASGCGCQ